MKKGGSAMHPSKKLICYLLLSKKNVRGFMEGNFNIKITNEDINNIKEEMKSILNIKGRFGKKTKRRIRERNEILKLVEDNKRTLVKLSSYKHLLFFLNTCLYRNIPKDVIVKVMNTAFSEEENLLFFNVEEIKIYEDLVFNFSDLEPYETKCFTLDNGEIADFENRWHITQVMHFCNIVPNIDEEKMARDLIGIAYSKAMHFITSDNVEDIKLGRNLGDFALKHARVYTSIYNNHGNDEVQQFVVEFDKSHANKPVLYKEIQTVETTKRHAISIEEVNGED